MGGADLAGVRGPGGHGAGGGFFIVCDHAG